MKKENTKSLFIRLPDGQELPAKTEIAKGIMSKDLKEKQKFLNYLIISILNDPYTDQQLMTVINHILPVQHKSPELKKLIFIYWEIINKRKHDGVILDEFMLVCNNLRKDLIHANEYIVGIALKLISRIAVPEIIEALMAPICDNGLNHLESFVRRNAVECLFQLYEKFGEEVVHDLDTRMTEFLVKETDINTKRNAIMLLFKVNPEGAVNYVVDLLENEGLECLADIIQLAIVRNLFRLCREDPSNKSKYLKVIFEFINSRFNSVLFEISNNISEFTSNWNALSSSVGQLIKLLQDTPDVNVKLIILERLAFFKSLGAKYLESLVPECLKILEKENTEVRVRILKLIEDFVDQSNVDNYLLVIKSLFHKSLEHGVSEKLRNKLQKYLLKVLTRIVKKKLSNRLNFKEQLFSDIFSIIIQHNFKSVSAVMLVKTFVDIVLFSKGLFTTNFRQLCIQNLLYVQNSDILETIVTALTDECLTAEDALEIISRFENLNNSLKDYITKTLSAANGITEDQAEKKRNVVSKTVVRADGTYGVEFVEESSIVAHNTIEADRFKFIINAMTSNHVFLVNFLRNMSKLLSLLTPENPETKKYTAVFCHSILLLYNMLQKSLKTDPSVFAELNLMIKDISKQGKEPRQFTGRSKKFSISKSEIGEEKTKEVAISQFDDLLNFRTLR